MATIEERAKKYCLDNYDLPCSRTPHALMGYVQGATDQRAIDIEEFSEWLNANWRKYIDQDADGMIRFAGWKNDFKNAMKL